MSQRGHDAHGMVDNTSHPRAPAARPAFLAHAGKGQRWRRRGRGRRSGRRRGGVSPAVTRFAAVRAIYGALFLLSPGPVIRLYGGHPADRRTRAVVRLLGVRHLAQAVVTAGAPDRAVLTLGAAADLLHAASMACLAACDRARARPALVDAVGAGSFMAVGAALARGPANPANPRATCRR